MSEEGSIGRDGSPTELTWCIYSIYPHVSLLSITQHCTCPHKCFGSSRKRNIFKLYLFIKQHSTKKYELSNVTQSQALKYQKTLDRNWTQQRLLKSSTSPRPLLPLAFSCTCLTNVYIHNFHLLNITHSTDKSNKAVTLNNIKRVIWPSKGCQYQVQLLTSRKQGWYGQLRLFLDSATLKVTYYAKSPLSCLLYVNMCPLCVKRFWKFQEKRFAHFLSWSIYIKTCLQMSWSDLGHFVMSQCFVGLCNH